MHTRATRAIRGTFCKALIIKLLARVGVCEILPPLPYSYCSSQLPPARALRDVRAPPARVFRGALGGTHKTILESEIATFLCGPGQALDLRKF